MSRYFKPLFWAALLFTLVMALLPQTASAAGSELDKLHHMAAFFTLAVLGRLAFPRVSLLWLLGLLVVLGGLIELAQLTPGLHRHADAGDWTADIIAAAIGLVAASLLRRFFVRT